MTSFKELFQKPVITLKVYPNFIAPLVWTDDHGNLAGYPRCQIDGDVCVGGRVIHNIKKHEFRFKGPAPRSCAACSKALKERAVIKDKSHHKSLKK